MSSRPHPGCASCGGNASDPLRAGFVLRYDVDQNMPSPSDFGHLCRVLRITHQIKRPPRSANALSCATALLTWAASGRLHRVVPPALSYGLCPANKWCHRASNELCLNPASRKPSTLDTHLSRKRSASLATYHAHLHNGNHRAFPWVMLTCIDRTFNSSPAVQCPARACGAGKA